METGRSYMEVYPGGQSVTWKDHGNQSLYHDSNPFGTPYQSNPVIMQDDMDNYRSGAYDYESPTSRFGHQNYHDRRRRDGYANYDTGAYSHSRPTSSFDDYSYDRRGPRHDFANSYRRGGSEYYRSAPLGLDDSNYYGYDAPSYGYSDSFASDPRYNRSGSLYNDYSERYPNSSEYSRYDNYNLSRSYGVYQYRS